MTGKRKMALDRSLAEAARANRSESRQAWLRILRELCEYYAEGFYRALFYSEEQGLLEKFRPYALPEEAWLDDLKSRLAGG